MGVFSPISYVRAQKGDNRGALRNPSSQSAR